MNCNGSEEAASKAFHKGPYLAHNCNGEGEHSYASAADVEVRLVRPARQEAAVERKNGEFDESG